MIDLLIRLNSRMEDKKYLYHSRKYMGSSVTIFALCSETEIQIERT